MNVVLIVATPGEASFFEDLRLPTVVSGIGMVNAALATNDAIREQRPDLVVSAGIGGAFPASGLSPGDVVVSSEIIYGGLGAMDEERFLDLQHLGFPLMPGIYNHLPVWDGARAWAAQAQNGLSTPDDGKTHVHVTCGPIMTLETVTGSAGAATMLERRFPGVLIEAMEGAGVAHAAYRAAVPAMEVRGVSNAVGPRDRASWEIRRALAATRLVLGQLPIN